MQFIVTPPGKPAALPCSPPMLSGARWPQPPFFSSWAASWLQAARREHLPASCDPAPVPFCALSAYNPLKNGGWRLESKVSSPTRSWGEAACQTLTHAHTHAETETRTHTRAQRWAHNVEQRGFFFFFFFVGDKGSPVSSPAGGGSAPVHTVQPHKEPCQLSTFLRVICEHNGACGLGPSVHP